MILLLKDQYISYLNSKRANFPPFDGAALCLKTEVASDVHFDIMDKQATICLPIGKGSATYHNPQKKKILFIDYEDFINKLPPNLVHEIKRCDFIAYEINRGLSFFILNELSQSSSAKNKLNAARQQLHATALNLCKTPDIQSFINRFAIKKCVFSNKTQRINTPKNIANAFFRIQSYLPAPIIHNYQPITKLGFELIETAIIEV